MPGHPITAFLLTAFLLVSQVNAQHTSAFKGGFLFNANGIQLEGQDAAYWSPAGGKIWGAGGLSLGARVQRSFSNHLFWALELRYIRKGSLYEYLTEYGLMEYEALKINYLEIPLLLGCIFRPDGKYRILETGFAVSRMFSSQLAVDKLVHRTGTPNADDFKDWDFSWVAAFKFPLNRRKADNLLFGVRAEHSVRSIHEIYKLYNFVYGVELLLIL
jgi:hypothetical protein